MGLRIRRSNRLFQNTGFGSNVFTSVGVPSTGISFRQSSNGTGPFLLGAAILVAISAVVWLLP